MKTPLQEIYAHLKASKEKDSFGETYCVDWLLENESKMLEKEKEVMCEFANDYADQVIGGMLKRSEQYYEETFKTK